MTDLTKDDLIDAVHKTNELEDTIADLKHSIDQLQSDPPKPDVDVEPDDIQEAMSDMDIEDEARQGAADFLDHLAHEPCENEACNDLRDSFGIRPDTEDDASDSDDTPDNAAEGGPEDADGDESTVDDTAAFPDEL
jgi:hypothetical protein